MGTSIVIPAYNAAGLIGTTVQACQRLEGGQEVLVVDDGSTDATGEEARAAGARVVRLPYNQGKGAALNQAAAIATGEVVVFLDADLGESAAAARQLVAVVEGGEADLAIACLPPGLPGGGLGLVKGLAAQGLYRRTGRYFRAPLSGQRAMPRDVMKALYPFAAGFGVEVAMTLKAARLGLRILEVDVPMVHRVTGRDLAGFYHRGKQFCHVLRALVFVR